MADAREQRNAAKKLVSLGLDPSQQKIIEKRQINENSFQAIAETYLEQQKTEWTKGYHTKYKSYLERDVYPIIGSRAVAEIKAPEIITIISAVAGRGAIDAAKRVKGFVQQIFDYALTQNKCERNPVKDLNLKMLLPQTIRKHYSAITDPVELGKLLRAIDEYEGGIVVKSALQLAPYVMARPSEICNAEWTEIDFDTATWFF